LKKQSNCVGGQGARYWTWEHLTERPGHVDVESADGTCAFQEKNKRKLRHEGELGAGPGKGVQTIPLKGWDWTGTQKRAQKEKNWAVRCRKTKEEKVAGTGYLVPSHKRCGGKTEAESRK